MTWDSGHERSVGGDAKEVMVRSETGRVDDMSKELVALIILER